MLAVIKADEGGGKKKEKENIIYNIQQFVWSFSFHFVGNRISRLLKLYVS